MNATALILKSTCFHVVNNNLTNYQVLLVRACDAMRVRRKAQKQVAEHGESAASRSLSHKKTVRCGSEAKKGKGCDVPKGYRETPCSAEASCAF